jgi:hypothetical protein
MNMTESAVSALRQFYASPLNGERVDAYSRFGRACQEWADENGISFLEASQRIHNIYNLNKGNK